MDTQTCGDEHSGCIDGAWYEPCGHENCEGLCEYAGVCQCTGCDNENCHTKRHTRKTA